MNNDVTNFIRARRIDSFQKLRFLLFLHQHPKMKGTSQDFAEQLYLGNTLFLEEIITDLQRAGLVSCVDNYYTLQDEPEVRAGLQYLARSFENPLARLELLNRMKYSPSIEGQSRAE